MILFSVMLLEKCIRYGYEHYERKSNICFQRILWKGNRSWKINGRCTVLDQKLTLADISVAAGAVFDKWLL